MAEFTFHVRIRNIPMLLVVCEVARLISLLI
jgi:hypothetical protein